jgi:hypothetical protein
MCWTKQVSLTLGCLGVVMTFDNYRRWKAGQITSIASVLVYALYTTMELFQYTQYVVGFETCNRSNEFLTLIAHILVWIQPVNLFDLTTI